MPPAAPRLSIIVPILEEALIVPTALARLAPLRAAGAEVIVVDGGSRDDSAVVAAAGADRVLIASRGRAHQMNAGAAVARGEMLLFLHVDTMLPAGAMGAIETALQGLASGRSAPSADSRSDMPVWGRFDVRIDGSGWLLGVVAAMMNARSRLTGIATGDQAMFVTRAAFAAVGGFPEQPLMEDIELSRRLLRLARPTCLHARVVTSGRRWETRGTWRTIALMWRLRLLYRLGVAPERLARSYR